MADVSVRFLNEAQVLRNIQQLAGVIETEKGIPQKVVRIESVKGIQQGFLNGVSPEGVPWAMPKSRPGGKPLQDHRLLYHSISGEIHGETVIVGTNDKRALMLHFGGRITPKKGSYLAIMQPGSAYHGSLRSSNPDAFVLKLGGKDYGYDRMWLVQKQEGAGGGASKSSFNVEGHGELKFIALLVKYIDEPGRPFIGMSLNTQDRILQRLTELAGRAWEGGNAPNVAD
jgi:phage gpG-like protein